MLRYQVINSLKNIVKTTHEISLYIPHNRLEQDSNMFGA